MLQNKGIYLPTEVLYFLICRGLNKEELELYTEMKARRDAEDEAKRATESSDEEVVYLSYHMIMLAKDMARLATCIINLPPSAIESSIVVQSYGHMQRTKQNQPHGCQSSLIYH